MEEAVVVNSVLNNEEDALSSSLEKVIIDKTDQTDEADDSDNDDDVDIGEQQGEGGEKKTKKKKKKKPKKKSKAPSGTLLPKSRLLGGFTDYYTKYGQTNPPTKRVEELFPSGDFPLGEIQVHGKTKFPLDNYELGIIKRTTDEEKR